MRFLRLLSIRYLKIRLAAPVLEFVFLVSISSFVIVLARWPLLDQFQPVGQHEQPLIVLLALPRLRLAGLSGFVNSPVPDGVREGVRDITVTSYRPPRHTCLRATKPLQAAWNLLAAPSSSANFRA